MIQFLNSYYVYEVLECYFSQRLSHNIYKLIISGHNFDLYVFLDDLFQV
jgi:hypothetical protein